MQKLVQSLIKYESILLFSWVIVIAIQFEDLLPLGPITIIFSGILAGYYLLHGRYGQYALAQEKVYIRMFPSLFGNFSSISVLGVFFRSMHYPGSAVMLNVGTIGLVVCCAALFYPPIQSHFQPVLKKFFLRIFVLVALTGALSIL